MKRDMDLIRKALLVMESGTDSFPYRSRELCDRLEMTVSDEFSKEEADNIRGHLLLLEDAGFVIYHSKPIGGQLFVKSITWKGHDFIDSVRDPKIWKQTKEGALAAGGWTFDILKDLAKGYLKKKIEEQTGMKI